MNNLNFTGGLPRDAEVRFTAKGDPIVAFSVSLTSGYGDNKVTNWINCTGFGKRYEALAPYLLKGTQVAISGEFTLRPWEGKEGKSGISPDVRVNEVTLTGGKSDGAPRAKEAAAVDADFDQDVPF